ncbi:MAG: DUF368 domain-containing protein [Oscillospiraceae bacterium]|nr:DUF368 domain-containing protein [Oscillospiraceae bacterium]
MNKPSVFLKGLLIGAGMTIPGISGGSLAIIAGLYNDLLNSVSNILKDFKRNSVFLIIFTLGGCAGLLLTASLITHILASPAGVPLRFAFLGAAAGCIPTIFRKSGMMPINPIKLLTIAAGMVCAALISLIPDGVFTLSDGTLSYFMQLIGGIIVAVALVLPGISASQMLYMLGMYNNIMVSVANGDFISLIPFSIGLIVGTFLSAKALSALFEKFSGTFLLVLGFMVFSLKDLIPQFSTTSELVIGCFCTLIGAALTYLISNKENKQNKIHDIVQKNS